MLQNVFLNSIADSLSKWMVVPWEDHNLLLLVTFILLKWKMMLQNHLNLSFIADNVLFHRLNSYHPNIKLTIEVNSSRFLAPNTPTSMIPINVPFIGKTQNYLHHGPPKLQNAINEIQSMVIFMIQNEYHQTLAKISLLIKEKIMKVDYP